MISNPHPVSILPSVQSSGGAIKELANSLRYGKVDFSDQKQQAALANALFSIQDQMDTLTRALRGSLPVADPVNVTDSSGQLVMQYGTIIGPTGQSYTGLWVADGSFFIGSTGPGGPGGTAPVLPIPNWATPTGAVSRATFDESSVTLPELAQRLAALIEDLLTSKLLVP